MIAYPRSEDPTAPPLKISIIGVGNAGIHLADRLTMAGYPGVSIVALNTDAQSLASSITPQKITLGQRITRGLGTGGDPEVGYEAAQESMGDIRAAVEGAQLVLLCAGLGGGTASGIAPVVAEAAAEAGAIVFSVVTSPFSFEGKRRSYQAVEALRAIAQHSQAIIHFENDRMAEISSPRAGIEETFAASDACLSACITSLLDLLRGGSPMPVSLADILAVVRDGSATALFGRGEATGENRAHEALERALKSPLLDRGRLIAESHAVVVHVSGPPNLSFSEVAAIMREMGKHTAEQAHLFLGVTTHPDQHGPVCVTVLGNYGGMEEAPAARVAPPVRQPKKVPIAPPLPVATRPIEQEPAEEKETPALFTAPVEAEEDEPVAAPVSRAREPRPTTTPAQPPAPIPPKVKQETLQFESVARGRFEKSEPTIIEGEDLDVPTFLRMRGKK